MARDEEAEAAGEETTDLEAMASERDQQEVLPGFSRTMSGEAGGELPESSSVRLTGGKLAVEGEYPKGAIVGLWMEARVGKVAFVDRVDSDGNVIGTERQHTLIMMRVRRTPDEDGS